MYGILVVNGRCNQDRKCSTKNCAFCNFLEGRE